MTPSVSAGPSVGLPPSGAPVTLFYSYAHEDEALRDELQGHLKILERRGLLAPWHDRKIVPGQDWAGRIDANLRSAELVLLLVSKDFIDSDYIIGTELRAAMERHAHRQSVVVPIIVRAVDLDPDDADALPFLKLQGLPTDLRPVTSWPNRDEAWTNVAKGLRATVKTIREQRPAAVAPVPAPDASQSGARTTRGGIGGLEDAVDALDGLLGRTFGHGTSAVDADAPAPRDDVLDNVVRGVVGQLDAAQKARGSAPLDAQARRRVHDDAQTLIDLPDQKRVLWVDDQPEGNRLETVALAKLQIEVVAVRDTDSALRCIGNDAEGFDLVISDWHRRGELPRAGLRLLQRLRAAGSAVPVVYYHGAFDAAERRRRAEQARAVGAFGEAVAPSDLMALVLRALSR